MTQTAIDGSVDWNALVAGVAPHLGRFDIVGGTNDPPEHSWGMQVNSMFAFLYPMARGTACSFWARAPNTTGALALVSVSEGQFVGRRSNVLGSFALQASDVAVTERWELVREVDMGSWSDADFAALGDGGQSLNDGSGALTWTVASSANANAGSATNGGFFRKNAAGDTGDDGGDGLRIFPDASVASVLTTAAQTAPRLEIPLSSLDPNYDETAEYMAQIHVTRVADSSAGVIPTARLFLALRGPVSTPTGSQERCVAAAHIRQAAGNASPSIIASNGNNIVHTDLDYNGTPPDNFNVIALLWGPSQTATAYAGRYNAGWPAFNTLRCAGTTAHTLASTASGQGLTYRENRISIGAAAITSVSGSVDFMVRRFRLLRRVR
jgi:hypothetical protein